MVPTEDREFFLKLFQAWFDAKRKFASTALVGNVGVLATTFTFIKEKNAEALGAAVLKWSTGGIVAAIFALALVWGFSDTIFAALYEAMVDGKEGKPTKTIGMRSFNIIFFLLLSVSGGCFLFCIAYFIGMTDAAIDLKK